MSDNDFILRLISKKPNEKIILAKIPKEKTLFNAVEKVMRRMNQDYASPLMIEGEKLKIPIVEFQLEHSYASFKEKKFLNKGVSSRGSRFQDYRVGGALQNILFNLGPKGVVLESSGAYEPYYLSADYGKKLRDFNFNKPFLVLLMEKGAKYPYFAAWIVNVDLMLKKNQSKSMEC